MAGIITIALGHDASYPWRQIGTQASGASSPAGYYLSPAAKGGEPPGYWTGRGCPTLGFKVGSEVERAPFEALYGKFLDPRDPAGETRLGRAPSRFRPDEEIYAEMLAAEPEATAERRAQLRAEARSQVRAPVLFFDATFSVSKSVTLLHASALASAAAAAARGDRVETGYWERVAAEVWKCVQAGNQAALAYLQDEAGYTRSGYHGRRLDGVEAGRWEDAHQWVIGSFAQHTSRDGDPQLHIHNLILNRVERERDGAWRTLDSRALFRHRAGASAIATFVMENEVSRRMAAGWVARPDGHGREVAGVTRPLMEEFSSRRHSIGPLAERMAGEFARQYGHLPDARAMGRLRQLANSLTRRGKETGPLDIPALVQEWAERARACDGQALEPVIGQVTNRRGPDVTPPAARSRPGGPLSGPVRRRLISEALACCGGARSTWTRADLIRHLGERLPADIGVIDPAEAAGFLPGLADEAIRGVTEPVLALEAPEWPPLPASLRRADGEGVYRPHGATRYATQARLTLEEQLVSHASEHGAPTLDRDTAATAVGVTATDLDAQVAASVPADISATPSGMRMDQAAALFWLATSTQRVGILVGPAGAGKTWTMAELARLWCEHVTGEVIGLTVSQAARNVLAGAGVTRAHNIAEFLGHLPGQRGARGHKPVARGSLIIVDEGSMPPADDLADIIAIGRERGCKVVIVGDHEQLAAVEGGGAMLMLTRRLGYAQLAEAVRFSAGWEREASLRLRAGDITVLPTYAEHGRIHSGSPEEATEQAYRGWLADHLTGRDSLVMARTEDQAAELSRRARSDLQRYGRVSTTGEVPLRGHAHASAGDLITARCNNRKIATGVPGRWLANRDVLEVVATCPGENTVLVRLRHGAKDGEPGPVFRLTKDYLRCEAQLAYASTMHAAIGRTVETGHMLADARCDRQGLYVGLSRGSMENHVYLGITVPAADVQRGAGPAAEIARQRALNREHAGLPAQPPVPSPDDPAAYDPETVLAQILGHDSAELSATEVLARELSNADHLGVLGAHWQDLSQQAAHKRFETALRGLLPPLLAEEALADPAVTWLWRSLRYAETAGLDGPQTLSHAVTARTLDGAHHIARVLDGRVRHLLDGVEPLPPAPWTERVPDLGDPEHSTYMRLLAELMQARAERLGEHTAETAPLWARQALGPLPDAPLDRENWISRAAAIATYREQYGYDHPGEPIGPAPAKTTPEARAAWRAALIALGRIDGIDLRGATDGKLWMLRGVYERETAWAPPHAGDALRLARLARHDARVDAIRAEHEVANATSPADRARHADLARVWRAVETKARLEEESLTAVQETRQQWEQTTEPSRRVAAAADAELRARHPHGSIPPLFSAEPDPINVTPADGTPPPATAKPNQPPSHTERAARETAARDLLGLTPEYATGAMPEALTRAAESAQRAQELLDSLLSLRVPDHDDELEPGPAWGILARRDRDALIQPPAPHVPPAPVITRLASHTPADAEPG